jgi:hypothetical protein
MLSVRLLLGAFAAFAVVRGLSGDMATVLGSFFWGSMLYRHSEGKKGRAAPT